MSPAGLLITTAEAMSLIRPFPHIVMDDLIAAETVRAINAEWPEQKSGRDDHWKRHRHAYSDKFGCSNWDAFGQTTRLVIETFNRPEHVGLLSKVFGIPELSADESLFGGGLHETFPGGFLGIHADFNIHPETKLRRRLNLLLFLNEDWNEAWGGDLELWNGVECCERIPPIAGRVVIFETSERAFHGHQAPLACPAGSSRRSIALYYYSPTRPDETNASHSTLYLGDEDNWPKPDA